MIADCSHRMMLTRALAVFVVVLMVSMPLVSMVPSGSDATDGSTKFDVVYQSGSPTVDGNYNTPTAADSQVTIRYYGVPVAEYNPQFWAGNITGEVISGTVSNWFPITGYQERTTVVFTGWQVEGSEGILDPGTDLSSHYSNGVDTITLTATWAQVNKIIQINDRGDHEKLSNAYFGSGSKYTNFVILNGDPTLEEEDGAIPIGMEGSAGFTIRSAIGTTHWMDSAHYTLVEHIFRPDEERYAYHYLGTDVIMDNLGLWTNLDSESHREYGLYANGHQLILGTGIQCNSESGEVDVVVYGGHHVNSAPHDDDTDLRIFSGQYASIYAGAGGSYLNLSSTNLVIMGQNTYQNGTVTSTTVISNTVYGGSFSGDVKETNVLMAGGLMNVSGNHDTGYPIGDSHSNIIGGTRNSGEVTTSSVTVTNRAHIFAVQGGGREAGTTVGTANVTVSGKAVVEYMVCGSVTNGNTNNSRIPVETTEVVITDEAEIGSESDSSDFQRYGYGSVFGGGWDTYTNALYRSTEQTKVVISGGTIWGSVYGGGFRGTIGCQNNGDVLTDSDHQAVSIEVFGGTIHGSVYGGGKGGIDPMSQSWAHANGNTGGGNTTGRAYVYGDITISITGGTMAAVYGGGQGAPIASDDLNYYGYASSEGGVDDCAKVVGDVTIRINGGSVTGGVYGGGLGDLDGEDIAFVTGAVVIGVTGGTVASVYGGGNLGSLTGSSTVEVSGGSVTGNVYGGGAGLEGNSDLGILDGTTSVEVSGGIVVENVYGGGLNGNVTGAASVMVGNGGTVTGNVYGGGSGNAKYVDQGSVQSASVTVNGTVGGSVFGGGNLGSVAGDVSVSMDRGEVSGNVYGGGSGQGTELADAATVGGNVSVTLLTSSVEGDLYGGGLGVPSSSSNSDTISVVHGSVEVSILDGSVVSGDLYGGGCYGALRGNQPGELQITIEDSEVHGSVYSGGMGETDRMATYLSNRVVVIVNGMVAGSVYGGSRDGNDNCNTAHNIDGTVTVTESQRGRSGIYIVSGDIAGGISGNIYGGGFRGYSNTDATILIGNPAADAVPGASPGGNVSIRSVYGGSSVGVSEEGMLNSQLLLGDTEIRIGSEGYDSFSISGDVFGAGDFCDIGGSSTVTFEDFSQDGSMLSIQKVDELNVVGSRLVLEGNMDGSLTTGSPMFSLNLIGQIVLTGDGTEGGRSEVVIRSAASAISGFSSLYSAAPTDYVGYNVLQIDSGMVFAIMGEDNRGSADGTITGQTVLRSDDNDYYGALVMGDTDALRDDPSFWVQTGSTYVPTRTADYESSGYRVWYLEGAYKLDQTVVFEDSSRDGTQMESDLGLTLPKIQPSSTITYAGHYVNPYAPHSMNLQQSEQISEEGSDVGIVFGSGTGIGTFFGDQRTGSDGSIHYSGLDLADQTGTVPATANNGPGLNITVSVLSGYDSTGYIGSVTIHFVEEVGGIVVSIFDVEVRIFLRIVDTSEKVQLNQDMVMRGSGPWNGATDVYLPFLADNMIGEYRIVSVSASGILSIQTVPTNLNRDGWNQSLYRTNPLVISQDMDTGDEPLVLGTGGVFSPVLRIGYEAEDYDPLPDGSFDFGNVTIVVELLNGGRVAKTITISIDPDMVTTVNVTFMDKVLDLTQQSSWTQDQELFTLGIDFGSSVSQYYVVVNTSMWNRTDAASFISSIDGSFVKDSFGNVLTSTDRTVLAPYATNGYEVLSVADLLETDLPDDPPSTSLLGSKPDTAYEENGISRSFDYSDNYPQWYDSQDGYGRFNFGSEVTEDLTVYAGYSVAITVHLYPGSPGSVNDTVLFPGAPGSAVDLTGRVDVSAGYEISEWYIEIDGDYVEISDSGFGTPTNFTTYSNVDVYVELVPEEYSLTVVVDDGLGVTITIDGIVREPAGGTYTYTVGQNVAIAVNVTGNQHVSGATANEGTWNRFKIDSNEVTFTSPAMDLDVSITISVGYTVTITMPSGGIHDDNELFGFDNGRIIEGGAGSEYEFEIRPGTSLQLMAPSFGTLTTVISLYGSDGSEFQYANTFSLSYGDLSQDVEYELYVNIPWDVSHGKNYSYGIERTDHRGNTANLSGWDGNQAYTGDIIVLTADSGYQFGTGFTAVGASLVVDGTTQREYSVNSGLTGSKTDVSFGDAEQTEFTVTVVVSFLKNGSPFIDEPSGKLFVTTRDHVPVQVSAGVWDSAAGMMTFTFPATSQTYLVSGQFAGFADVVEAEHTVEVDGSITVDISFVAVAQTIVFSDGDTVLHTYTGWYIGDTTPLSKMYDGAGAYRAWAYGGGLIDNVDEPTSLDIELFEDGPLTMICLPNVADIPIVSSEQSIIIHSSQLEGNGFSIRLQDSTGYTISFSGDLRVEARWNGNYLTLRSGDPGTGSFHITLEGPATVHVLHVVVVGSVEDIGRAGVFMIY